MNPTKIKKAILPVAGLGTRFFPATLAIPKEMLPVVDKPIIQYLVEEAINSGIEEIIFVNNPGKKATQEHFTQNLQLEKQLLEKGKEDLLKKIKNISNLAKFTFVEQPQPLGDGHAILCAKKHLNNEPALILFGDELIDHEIPASKQLLSIYQKTGSPIIALERIPQSKTNQYGVIKAKSENGRTYEIESMVEKPTPKEAPSNLGVIGKYIITPEVIEALEEASSTHSDGEIRLIDGFINLLKKETKKIYGYELEGQRYDTGNQIGLIKATVNYGLKNPEMKEELTEFLKKIKI